MSTKRPIQIALLTGLYLMTGSLALASDLSGTWQGTASAILPGGTVIDDITFVGTVEQNADTGLLSATFTFTVRDPISGDEVSQDAVATGYAGPNGKVTGLLSAILDDQPLLFPSGFLEGKLSGNRFTGVVRDLSDGSTSILTATRMR